MQHVINHSAKIIPFTLYNISDFVVEKHPEYHPYYEADSRNEYWENFVGKCLRGVWGDDSKDGKGGYRFCPGNLYFYINATQIKDEGSEGTEVWTRPLLRDIEWYMFYALTECDGFSGFSEDREYTAYEPVGKLQGKVRDKNGQKIPLTNKEKLRLEKGDKNLKKPNGEWKEYKTPKELLYKTYRKPMGIPLYHNEMKNLVVLSSRGIGKEQPHSEPILTPNGWETMGTIKVGDQVIGSNGLPCNVLDKFPQGEKDVYKITLSDGREIRAGKDHLWKVFDRNKKKGVWTEKTTGELLKGYKRKRIDSKHKAKYGEIKYIYEYTKAIPLPEPIEYPERDLDIDPYSLGFEITTQDGEIKRIPEEYLFSSVEQRLELLRGLMDSGGTCSGHHVEFYDGDKSLVYDVASLARSLGIYTQVKDKIENKKYYGVTLKTDLKIFNLEEEHRCHVESQPHSKSGKSRLEKVFIKNIEKLPYKEESSCIMVDSPDHTYITTDYAVTHNSYSVANGVILYDFVFGSARDIRQFKRMDHPSTVVVGSFLSSKTKELLDKTLHSYEWMKKSLGVHPDVSYEEEPCPLFQPYIEGGVLESGGVMTNSVRDEGSGTGSTGTGSQIVNISYHNNHQAGVAYRARRMVIEEAGLLRNFKDVHGANAGTQQRSGKTGYTIYIGTGGDMKAVQGIRDAFLNPDAYDCVTFEDVFENKPNRIGLFVPSYYRVTDYKDENGNTDLEMAFQDELRERERIFSGSKARYESHRVWYPIVPKEMFMSESINPFPSELLDKRFTELETGLWRKIANPVKLYYTNDENTKAHYQDIPLETASIIKRFGDETKMTDDEIAGTVVIYEHPGDSRVPFDYETYRYLVTYDPVKNPEGGTSVACVQVWKFWELENMDRVQFNLVAEWLGRHIGSNSLSKDHEIAFKLAAYYECPILPETNIRDVIRHAYMTNRFWMLMPTPGIALGDTGRSRQKVGINVIPGMKRDLEGYLAEVFNKSVHKQHILEGDSEYFEEIKMAEMIPSMRLIEEAIYYNRDGNFDAVSAAFLFALISRQRDEEMVESSVYTSRAEELEDFINFAGGEQMEPPINSAFNY